MSESNSLLSESVRNQIDVWLTKFPTDQKQSALLPALMATQKANGNWLSTELMDAVAEYLDLPKITVYEAVTFYSMFETKPVGKNMIYVCDHLSCQLCGSDKVVDHLKKKLDVEVGETTEDGKFTLQTVECLGACVNAPMMQVNDDYHEHLTEEKIDKLLETL